VVDKFSFVEGRVSFRVAFFDLTTFIGYLSQTYGLDQLTDFLLASFKQTEKTGGIQSLPSMIWNLLSGLFFWPDPPATSPCATVSDGIVTLNWEKTDKAISYKITRATALGGDYESPSPDGDVLVDEPTHSYEDSHVTHGTPYWYLVSPIFEKWKPTPVKQGEPMSSSPSRRRRLEGRGYSLG